MIIYLPFLCPDQAPILQNLPAKSIFTSVNIFGPLVIVSKCLNVSVLFLFCFFNAQAGLYKASDQAVEQPTKSILGYLVSYIIEY